MSEHTKEPWVLGGCSGRMITTPDGYTGDGFIADVDTLDNASRIVACVNACKGLTTEQLSDSVFYGLIQGTILILKLESEKKQIFDAASKMARFIRTWEDCLSGVQMSEEDFNEDCGLKEWRRVKASVINGPQS
jgi:hypothetical protein